MGFIFDSFIRGMFDGNRYLKDHISKEVFWVLYRRILEELFHKPGVNAWIMCLPDDPSVIIGYLVHSKAPVDHPQCLHWVHLKKDFRGFGLAKKLLGHAGFSLESKAVYTHTTDTAKTRHPKDWELKPYLFF